MSRNTTTQWWINEQEIDPSGNPSVNQPTAAIAPDANVQDPNATIPPADTNQQVLNQSPPEAPKETEEEDVSEDPNSPDMPEETEKNDENFELWKDTFFKESIKGDANKLMDLIHKIRDMELDSYPRKFVEDNLQICFLRQNANIQKASDSIRKLLHQELDKNNPAVSLVNHISQTLKESNEINPIFIKIKGLLGMKADLHRKFIASLIGGVQVGTGGNLEDVVYNERDFSIRISTRFNDKWGRVDIGKWSMREDDPKKFLSDPEIKRLEDGSPEEKDVLRKRICLEALAESFKKRAFIINVANEDGTVYTLGWDISNCIRNAYEEGKLIIKLSKLENSEAMISDDGSIVSYVDIKIKYAKESGELDDEGNPSFEELDFMERIDGVMFLTASYDTVKEAVSNMQGIILKEEPYKGNPSDLRSLQRCVPNSSEILLRQC